MYPQWVYCEKADITGPGDNPTVHPCNSCLGCIAWKQGKPLDYWRETHEMSHTS